MSSVPNMALIITDEAPVLADLPLTSYEYEALNRVCGDDFTPAHPPTWPFTIADHSEGFGADLIEWDMAIAVRGSYNTLWLTPLCLARCRGTVAATGGQA